MATCTYCGSDLAAYDAVCVTDCDDDAVHGRFCNFGCLDAHIDEADLAVGTSCHWEPDAEGCC